MLKHCTRKLILRSHFFNQWNNIFIVCTFVLIFITQANAESICYGTTKKGALKNGVKLPASGPNFESYGKVPQLAGRTYVHDKVRDVLVQAFHQLESSQAGKRFKYAETGFEDGGQFKPHKTHQNGLSVDFMVPVINQQGESVYLPTHPFNKYGYNIEFDKNGRFDNYQIDFDALGAHLKALHQMAEKNKIKIWRVLFDPRLQALLYQSKYGSYVKKHIFIPNKKSWVRHDEHYHVDFDLPCRNLNELTN